MNLSSTTSILTPERHGYREEDCDRVVKEESEPGHDADAGQGPEGTQLIAHRTHRDIVHRRVVADLLAGHR